MSTCKMATAWRNTRPFPSVRQLSWHLGMEQVLLAPHPSSSGEGAKMTCPVGIKSERVAYEFLEVPQLSSELPVVHGAVWNGQPPEVEKTGPLRVACLLIFKTSYYA